VKPFDYAPSAKLHSAGSLRLGGASLRAGMVNRTSQDKREAWSPSTMLRINVERDAGFSMLDAVFYLK
jgi:hypothetical protein